MKNKIINCIFFTIIYFLFSIISCNCAYASNEKITLISTINGVTNSITNTYTYTIKPVNNNNNAQNEPTVVKVNFNNIKPESNKAIATHDIDFSKTSYSKLGVYEYIITETSSSDSETFPLSKDKYKIFVEVIRDKSDNVVKNVHFQALDLNVLQKSELEFTHQAEYTYINIENTTTGKMANKNEYFKYKLSIFGNVGDIYEITGQDETVYFEGKRITPAKHYIVKSGSDNYIYIYLKDNQKISIGLSNDIPQIKIGTKYIISKVGARKWETIINDKHYNTTNYLVAKKGVNKIDIVNIKNFDIALTGVFIDVLPFVILIILAVFGIFAITKLKKKNDDYDK